MNSHIFSYSPPLAPIEFKSPEHDAQVYKKYNNAFLFLIDKSRDFYREEKYDLAISILESLEILFSQFEITKEIVILNSLNLSQYYLELTQSLEDKQD